MTAPSKCGIMSNLRKGLLGEPTLDQVPKYGGVVECVYVVVTYPSLSSPRPLLPPVSALASNRGRRWQGESLAGKCHGDNQG